MELLTDGLTQVGWCNDKCQYSPRKGAVFSCFVLFLRGVVCTCMCVLTLVKYSVNVCFWRLRYLQTGFIHGILCLNLLQRLTSEFALASKIESILPCIWVCKHGRSLCYVCAITSHRWPTRWTICNWTICICISSVRLLVKVLKFKFAHVWKIRLTGDKSFSQYWLLNLMLLGLHAPFLPHPHPEHLPSWL